MAELIIIRGLPGSGKSTIARRDFPYHAHFEADMYHYKEGEYCFEMDNIKPSHEWCKRKVKESLEAGNNTVVANTFTQLWEMDFYLSLPFPHAVIVADGEYDNIHGVPSEIIDKMKGRWEECHDQEEVCHGDVQDSYF